MTSMILVTLAISIHSEVKYFCDKCGKELSEEEFKQTYRHTVQYAVQKLLTDGKLYKTTHKYPAIKLFWDGKELTVDEWHEQLKEYVRSSEIIKDTGGEKAE